MKPVTHARIFALNLAWGVTATGPVGAFERLGTRNASLLGGDLTDPKDAVKEKEGVDYGQDKSEDDRRPLNGNSPRRTPPSPLWTSGCSTSN